MDPPFPSHRHEIELLWDETFEAKTNVYVGVV